MQSNYLVPLIVGSGVFMLHLEAGNPPIFGVMGALVAALFAWFVSLFFSNSDAEINLKKRRDELNSAQVKAVAERDTNIEQLSGRIHFNERGGVPSGWILKRNLGVIRCVAKMQSDAINRLNAKAAALGANGVINRFHKNINNEADAVYGMDAADHVELFNVDAALVDGKITDNSTWIGTATIWEGIAVCVTQEILVRSKIESMPQSSHQIKSARNEINCAVIDGNNAMMAICSKLNGSDLYDPSALRSMIKFIESNGIECSVMFDANIHHKLFGRFAEVSEISSKISVPESRVSRVPKGKRADPFILDLAQKLGAHIISNDHYDDYDSEFPILKDRRRLLGMVKTGRIIQVERIGTFTI